MSLLDQNWGDLASADDETLENNQHGRQVIMDKENSYF